MTVPKAWLFDLITQLIIKYGGPGETVDVGDLQLSIQEAAARSEALLDPDPEE